MVASLWVQSVRLALSNRHSSRPLENNYFSLLAYAFAAGLRHNQLSALLVIDDLMNGITSRAYVEELIPELNMKV